MLQLYKAQIYFIAALWNTLISKPVVKKTVFEVKEPANINENIELIKVEH